MLDEHPGDVTERVDDIRDKRENVRGDRCNEDEEPARTDPPPARIDGLRVEKTDDEEAEYRYRGDTASVTIATAPGLPGRCCTTDAVTA